MRHFSSYGPVEAKAHFAVERRELVDRCVTQLIGQHDESGGHYFTIWGPRQTGKTWIMRRAVDAVRAQHGDRFIVGMMTLQGLIEGDEAKEPLTSFLEIVPELFQKAFAIDPPVPRKWSDWRRLFRKEAGVFDRPLILLLDEFDSLPPKLIDRLVAQFREMYLDRNAYWLHGLALIGVRSVLGVDSPRGSPFNVQRSLQVPNLTQAEVVELFRQYQSESGQVVEPEVVTTIYESTRGQPGLVSWFGELLTEKYNPGQEKLIDDDVWQGVYARALAVEFNNTVLNLIKKARGDYRPWVLRLFTDPNVAFSMDKDWCNYLFTNGIIDEAVIDAPEKPGRKEYVCRFSSPFVQRRLYAALTDDMFGDKGPLLAIEMGDTLEDVFTAERIDAPKLLERYRGYLKRLQAQGIDPWVGQPRRADLHYREAVGHFHLYAWLQNAVGRRCGISPEFPTGNGKVDLVLKRQEHTAVIEVKSLSEVWELQEYWEQAARYATKLGLKEATLVVFAPVQDESILQPYAIETQHEGVRVKTVPFGWV
jgi:hypothetical protein